MSYLIRFDMRAPAGATSDRYAAAIEMAAWAENNGGGVVVLSEHHGVDDGYLPSPLVLASAMAARTERIPIVIAAVILPLHDPVRLAEDMMVLDLVSGGRVSYVLGLGYRAEEYEMYGIPMGERALRADTNLGVLQQALRGKPFEHFGRRIAVTPNPCTPGGPHIAWGGRSKAAARRAARFGLDFMAQDDDPALETAYHDEAVRCGLAPGTCTLTAPDAATNVFVADDMDAAWAELGPYLLHDANQYASWNVGTRTANISRGTSIDELRAEQGAYRIVTVPEAADLVRTIGFLSMHPLCGGIPPDVAWPYLERVASVVVPEVEPRSP